MNDDEKRAVIAKGYATLARTADVRVEHRDYDDDPPMRRRGQPRQELPAPERKVTDAELSSRWQAHVEALVERRVAAALADVEQMLGQHRAATADWIKASAKAITRDHTEIEKLDLRLSALLQSVEKMQRGLGDDAKIIDLPNLTRDRSRAG